MTECDSDGDDNGLLPGCWFPTLVIKEGNEWLPLLYYCHSDALEQGPKAKPQLRTPTPRDGSRHRCVCGVGEQYHKSTDFTSSLFGSLHTSSGEEFIAFFFMRGHTCIYKNLLEYSWTQSATGTPKK